MTNLGETSLDLAGKAAAQYCNVHDITIGESGLDRLLGLLRIEVKNCLTSALNDVKNALDANMPQAASATFAASMRVAGITAARKFAAA